jgi:(5-formylfuran-3-yl)methyl phosphate synthase
MKKLLVSVRGKTEAIEAVKGGAKIADVEFPKSALGTPYPLNIWTIRQSVPKRVLVSTNIGEEQPRRSTAAQAALGVAIAGADIIKAGLAEMEFKDAFYLAKIIVRTVKYWYPRKQVIPTFFADTRLAKILDPIEEAPALASKVNADGVLIDTFDKKKGKRLIDYYDYDDMKVFVRACHKRRIEAWIAGSITKEELPFFWEIGVDVICVRGAACGKTDDRMGKVKKEIVRGLVRTIPSDHNMHNQA